MGTYRKSFYSTETGAHLTRRLFLNGEEDDVRSRVFKNNKKHWLHIEDQIEEWVRTNWDRWLEEKPEWFTERWRKKGELRMIHNNKVICSI